MVFVSRRVRIVGVHPHSGETGTVHDDVPMFAGLWRVDLDAYEPGLRGCYVAPENLRLLDTGKELREPRC